MRRLLKTPPSVSGAFWLGFFTFAGPLLVNFLFAIVPMSVRAGKTLEGAAFVAGLVLGGGVLGGLCFAVPALLYGWAYRQVIERGDLWRRPPSWFR